MGDLLEAKEDRAWEIAEERNHEDARKNAEAEKMKTEAKRLDQKKRTAEAIVADIVAMGEVLRKYQAGRRAFGVEVPDEESELAERLAALTLNELLALDVAPLVEARDAYKKKYDDLVEKVNEWLYTTNTLKSEMDEEVCKHPDYKRSRRDY